MRRLDYEYCWAHRNLSVGIAVSLKYREVVLCLLLWTVTIRWGR